MVFEVFGLFGLCLGIASGVDQLWGKFWPTDPIISPHDSASETSLILPFNVENESVVFAMDDVQFTCGVDLVWAKDSIGSPIMARDQAFLVGAATIEPNRTIPVDCDASDLLTVNADGVLSFDGSSTILNNQHPWFPPWTIVKMCLWLGGTYKIAGIIPASFKSEIFQWPAAPGSGAWADGAVVQIARKNQTIPGFLPGSTDCSARIQYPYGLVQGPGQELLVFK